VHPQKLYKTYNTSVVGHYHEKIGSKKTRKNITYLDDYTF